MSEKRMFPILYMLPTGKENAITTEELVKLSGCGSARELQKQIAFEREHGALICSGAGRGYWRPKDNWEVREFVRIMDAKSRNIQKATEGAKKILLQGDTEE